MHPDRLAELRRLRTKYTAGTASVVNPRVGGSHGDLAQALALACHEAASFGSGASEAEIDWDPYPLGGTVGTFDVPAYGSKL